MEKCLKTSCLYNVDEKCEICLDRSQATDDECDDYVFFLDALDYNENGEQEI